MIRMWNLLEIKGLGLILGSLALHMRRVNCLRINPFRLEEMISCCENGTFGVWFLPNFELRYSFTLSSYLKDMHFIDEMRIRVAGGGGKIYECFSCDGVVRQVTEVDGTCVNSMSECFLEESG